MLGGVRAGSHPYKGNIMTTVFIGGSRRITRLNDTIRSRADNIMRQRFAVVIGDANGADKAIQTYLASKGYRNVVVYFMDNHCRNNVGSWPVEQVSANHQRKNFAYYATKDKKMAQVASYGFMIWDGKSKGTLNNILNLLQQQKNISVYFSPDKSCYKLKSLKNLTTLLHKCGGDIKRKFEREFTLQVPARSEVSNFELFAVDKGG